MNDLRLEAPRFELVSLELALIRDELSLLLAVDHLSFQDSRNSNKHEQASPGIQPPPQLARHRSSSATDDSELANSTLAVSLLSTVRSLNDLLARDDDGYPWLLLNI